MRFRYWVALFAVALFALTAGAWIAMGRPSPGDLIADLPFGGTENGKDDGPKKPPLKVSVAEAKLEEVPITFEYTGTIVSPKDAELQARVTGVVTDRPFEPGSMVTKDQLLFQIDKRPFEISLKSDEAKKSQAEASLGFAKSQVSRASTLIKKGFETAQRTQQLKSQEAGASSALQQAEAGIEREKLNIEYSTIRAPFDGRVSLSMINVGDTVIMDQTKLASVVQVDPIDLQVALSADDAEAVREAMSAGKAKVSLLDADGKPEREAKIYKLDNRFDPRTARRLVRALVHNEDGRYLPGQFVRARVETGTRTRILVSTLALSTQLDQQIVYAVDKDGTVRVLPVETGDVYGTRTAITKGLKADTMVAVDHLQRLHEGMKVEVKPQEAQDASRS